jgi:hypothetical protein
MVAMVRKDEEEGPADRVPHLPWMRYPSTSTPSPAAPSHCSLASTRGALLMLQHCPCDRLNWPLAIFGCSSEVTSIFYICFAVRKRVGNYSADCF